MNNNHASTILGQIERIEKRMTSMQERGIDISALSSQVIVAREMLNDARYDDASIFCQEIMDLADRIINEKQDETPPKNNVIDSVAVDQEDTKRFGKSSSTLNQQIKDAVDVGMLSRLRGQMSEHGLLDSSALHNMRDEIMQRVSQDVRDEMLKKMPEADMSQVETAFNAVLSGGDQPTNGDVVNTAIYDLISKSMDQSFKLYEQQLKMLLDQLFVEQQQKVSADESSSSDDVMSVQLVRTGGQSAGTEEEQTVSGEQDKERDDESFAGLPRIPRHGEPLEDDSTFHAVTIDPTLSSSVFQSETETASQHPNAEEGASVSEKGSEHYEPVTGSSLRPNTSVFTESNTMQPPQAQAEAPPVASEISTASDPAVGSAIPIQDLKVLLKEMLPSLLQDEEIKQALFASLALEMVTKPSVLGSLSGLRAYLQQELEAAQSSISG